MLAILFVACLSLTACNSTDTLIDKYVAACQDHDSAKALKIAEKLKDKEAELTPEQISKINSANMELYYGR